MGADVRVVYRKYDGSLHWNMTLRRLGEDEHGTWLGAPPGSSARRGNEPPVTYRHAYVMLVPRGRWWTAVFNARPEPHVEVYCDITTVPEWRVDERGHEPERRVEEVTMVDLDLDVIRLWDGRVEIVDRDEFAEHRVRYAYPEAVVAGAERSARLLHAAVGDGTEPFAEAYRPWLDRAATA